MAYGLWPINYGKGDNKMAKDLEFENGVYETIYGNAAMVKNDEAYDLDAGEAIPLKLVDETKFIRELGT